MNTTAIIITAIICATFVLLSLINKGSRGNHKDKEDKE